MLIEWLYELKDQIDRHGIRWGVALTLLALFRKERRNQLLDKRDDALFHNQRVIMETLGVGDQFVGHQTMSSEDRQNFKKLLQLYWAAISQAGFLFRRRGRRMNKPWLAVLVGYILAQITLKTGLVIPPETTDWIVDGFTIFVPVLLAFMNKTHDSQPAPVSTTKTPLNIEEAKPFLIEISKDIQEVFDQVQSGKYTEQSQKAMEVAMAVYDLMKSKKGA